LIIYRHYTKTLLGVLKLNWHDLAPTILKLLELHHPKEITGDILI